MHLHLMRNEEISFLPGKFLCRHSWIREGHQEPSLLEDLGHFLGHQEHSVLEDLGHFLVDLQVSQVPETTEGIS